MKTSKSTLFSIFLLFVISNAIGQDDAQISKEYISTTLKQLSSDELKGRKVFSAEIDKAAELIGNEFKATGLSFLPGLKSYRQDFKMYNLTTEGIEVKLDGVNIAEAQLFGLFKEVDINWTEKSDVNVIRITSEQHFQQEFSKVGVVEKSTLVLVDKSHEAIYSRYQQYFSRGSSEFEKAQGNSVVFALADNLDAKEFSVKVNNRYEEKSLANVVGRIEGKRKEEIVLFSGHYDHIGVLEAVAGDSIANGANDDASGTTAVMALAKYFKGQEQPERTIYFVAFTAEEAGGFGSQYFSKQLNPDHIVAMFNIEMIGKPAVEGPNTAWITGFDRSSFGELLQKSVEGTKYTFYADPYPSQNLFYRSDNATLARLGVPAHTISTTPIDVDEDYHQVSDEFDTIDIDHMTNTIKAIATAAEGIVSGTDTPTRVDTSKVE